MATVLRMPGVSADATEAALVDWAVQPGAQVRRGDVIASVETDKAVVDLEAEEDAVLLRTFVSAGDAVPVGGPIAVFVQPGEEARGEDSILAELGLGPQDPGPVPPGSGENRQDTTALDASPETGHAADPAGSGGERRLFASPLARRMANETGVRLEEITGSGPGGRIRRRDIEEVLGRRNHAAPAATEPTPTPTPTEPARTGPTTPVGYTDVPFTRFQRAAAQRLTASKQQVPHFYLKATCRVDQLLGLRAAANATGDVKITVNDFIVRAAGLALVDVPDMNVSWTPDAIRRFESADIAVAVASERGLVTPVVRSVPHRTLSDISRAIKDLAARANTGRLQQGELEGGAMTVSNLGMFGTEEFAAIINPPQAGILAVGAATSRPTETGAGAIGLATFITVVLSVDHRPVDGAIAARWLSRFKDLIENPVRLLV